MSIDVRHCSIDCEIILISGQAPVGHSLCQLVEASTNGQWLPIPHPGDSGGRGASGDTGQGGCCGTMSKSQACDARRSCKRK